MRIERVEADLPGETCVGGDFAMKAWVRIGSLSPSDIEVQAYVGRVDENQQIVAGSRVRMVPDGAATAGEILFRAQVHCTGSGTHGLKVRVLPRHEDLERPHGTGLIVWGA